MSGKGSAQRPTNRSKFNDNFDKIFGKKSDKELTSSPSPEITGELNCQWSISIEGINPGMTQTLHIGFESANVVYYGLDPFQPILDVIKTLFDNRGGIKELMILSSVEFPTEIPSTVKKITYTNPIDSIPVNLPHNLETLMLPEFTGDVIKANTYLDTFFPSIKRRVLGRYSSFITT